MRDRCGRGGRDLRLFPRAQGYEVTLPVDGRPRPGEETSYANGGQLSYSYVAPLAGPGVLPSVPALAADATTRPCSFHPRLDPHQRKWCLRIRAWRAAPRCPVSVTAEMLTLSYLTPRASTALARTGSLSFSHLRNGKLRSYTVACCPAEGARPGGVPGQPWRRPAGADCRANLADGARAIGMRAHLAGRRGYAGAKRSATARALPEGMDRYLSRQPNVRTADGHYGIRLAPQRARAS